MIVGRSTTPLRPPISIISNPIQQTQQTNHSAPSPATAAPPPRRRRARAEGRGPTRTPGTIWERSITKGAQVCCMLLHCVCLWFVIFVRPCFACPTNKQNARRSHPYAVYCMHLDPDQHTSTHPHTPHPHIKQASHATFPRPSSASRPRPRTRGSARAPRRTGWAIYTASGTRREARVISVVLWCFVFFFMPCLFVFWGGCTVVVCERFVPV